jgi:hypothetical protein
MEKPTLRKAFNKTVDADLLTPLRFTHKYWKIITTTIVIVLVLVVVVGTTLASNKRAEAKAEYDFSQAQWKVNKACKGLHYQAFHKNKDSDGHIYTDEAKRLEWKECIDVEWKKRGYRK